MRMDIEYMQQKEIERSIDKNIKFERIQLQKYA